MGQRWIMMRANDIRPLQNQDVPTPLGTYDTIEKFPSALASLAVLPPRWPTGEPFGGTSQGDADAQPRDVPNSYGEVVGTGPSWDSWCHRGTFAFGRLTEPAFTSYALQVRRELDLHKAHRHSSLEPVKIRTRLFVVIDWLNRKWGKC